MDSFVKKVRKSKVLHPTQQDFTLAGWQQEFAGVGSPSAADRRLFDAGVWAFEQLDQARRNVKTFALGDVPTEKQLRFSVAVTNRNCHYVSREMRDTLRHSGYLVEQTVQFKVSGNPHGLKELAPDDAMTATVDGTRFVLSDVLSNAGSETEGRQELSDVELVQHARGRESFGQIYTFVNAIWMDCLWNGWYVEATPQGYLMSPPEGGYAEMLAVSEYRRQVLSAEDTFRAIDAWKHELSDEERRRFLSRLPQVTIKGSGKKKTFSVRGSVDPGITPTTYINRHTLGRGFYGSMLDLPLPRFPKLTLNKLLDSWDLLSALAAAWSAMLPADTRFSTPANLLKYAPVLYKDQVVELLTSWLHVRAAEAQSAVDFFTFSGSARGDLWSAPLVGLGRDRLTLMLAPLLHGNMPRTFDVWTKAGGFNLTEKGFLFEEYARDEAGKALAASTVLRNAGVYKKALLIKEGAKEEEIDVVIWVGDLVLIGEAKCQVFPSEPLERHRYLQTLEGAAGQLERKYSAVLRNKGAVLRELGLDERLSTDQVRFIPFILTNHALGVGRPVKGTPIIDIHMLRQYLRDGTWHPLTERSAGGSVGVGSQRLYADEEDASRSLGELLMKPPQTEFYRHHLQTAHIMYGHLPLRGKRLKRIEYEVRLPVST